MKVAIASLLVLISGAAFACPGDKSASTTTAPVAAKDASTSAAAERAKAAKRAQVMAQVQAPTRTVAR